MATINEIIARVDEVRPNCFPKSVKLAWIASLDGKIAADVFLWNIIDLRRLEYKHPEDLDSEPLVTYPHQDIYEKWLEAMIDLENGEYDRYQNDMAVYNEFYNNFVSWFVSTYEPAQGYERRN